MRRGGGIGSRRRTVLLPCVTVALFIAAMLVPAISSAGGGIGGVGRIPPTTVQTPQGTGKSGGSSGAASGLEGAGKVPPLTGQPLKGAAPGTVSTAPLPVTPKAIQINPALLGGLTKGLLNTDTKPAAAELDAAMKETAKSLHEVENSLGSYQARARYCTKKSFTTEDQKKAGCVGTDTLDQCSAKLFQYCFHHPTVQPGKSGLSAFEDVSQGLSAGVFPSHRKKLLDASDRLDKALKEYTSKLKLIPEYKESK